MSDPIPLYRYLDSDAALKTIVARAFRVGKPSNFNDPFEWRLGMAGIEHDLAKKIIDGFVSEVNSDMQGILCFSDTVSDPVLWSIYAEKHRGVAFEIKHAWPQARLPLERTAAITCERCFRDRTSIIHTLSNGKLNGTALDFVP
jgi:hypothetical protein